MNPLAAILAFALGNDHPRVPQMKRFVARETEHKERDKDNEKRAQLRARRKRRGY